MVMPRQIHEYDVHSLTMLPGPISSITVMGQTIVIANNARTATELLSRRSAIYSSRPKLVFASEMSVFERTRSASLALKFQ